MTATRASVREAAAAPSRRRLHRHPSDVARLVFNLALLAGFVVLDWLAPSGLRAFAADLLTLVGALPRPLVGGMVGVVQLLAVAVPLVGVVVLLWRRQFALVGILVLAVALAAALMALLTDWFVETVPIDSMGLDRIDSWLVGGQFPSSTYLCGATAVLVAAGPWLSRRWRRAGWIFLAATLVTRVLTATEVPIRIGVLVSLGAACGSLALVLVGAPRRRVDEETVAAALDRAGLAPHALRALPDGHGLPTIAAAGPGPGGDGDRASTTAPAGGGVTTTAEAGLGGDVVPTSSATDPSGDVVPTPSATDPGDVVPISSATGPGGNGVPTFTAAGPGGVEYHVKVLGRDERDSDLLIYALRRLTLRGLGDGAPGGSPERVVEHEALALGLFASAGVAVPKPVATVGTPEGAAVLVTSAVVGERLCDLPAEAVGDDLLDAVWRQVAVLQHRRLAHGRLNAAHVVVAGGDPVLVDLRWADLDSNDEALGVDVAELLASLTVTVGAERAVAAAARELPVEHLARAVPLVQTAVLSTATRRALTDDKATLADLRTRLAAVAGVEEVELAPVQRITVKGAVSLVGSLVLGWYLLSLAANWQDIWDAFGEANLAYAVPVLLLTAGTYVGGAVSLLGAVTTHLALLRTTAVMFGQAFLNRFTPANAGGMAMRVRYLQLSGLETPAAVTAIGLTSGASGLAHGVFIVVFFIWGGASDRFSDFEFPNVGTILIIVLVIGLAASAVLFSQWGRTSLRPWLRGVATKVRDTVGELAKSPGKMAMLLGGASFVKLCNVTTFWLSVLAFDVTMSFPKAGALYMIASTVGSAVPTPGGVGGVEAALTAVLIGFGVDSATAAAIVLFFRTLTYWVPTLPGYGFLQYTQRRGIV